jgi:hypothetical protein
MFATMSANVFAADADARSPVPGADAQAKSRSIIHEVFGADFAKRGIKDRRQLARKLFDQAKSSKDDPAAAYVLLSESIDIAGSAGDMSAGMAAVDELVRRFEVDSLAIRLRLIQSARGAVQSPAESADLARAALALGDEALSVWNADVALRATAIAEAAGRSSQDNAFASRVREQSKLAAQMSQLQQDEAVERRLLKEHPDDTVAGAKLGRILCFARGDWDEGLNFLARVNDESVLAAVREEARKPNAAPAMLKAAEAWWNVGATAPVPQNEARQRAGYWYRRAAPDLKGINKALAQKRLGEIFPAASAASASFEVAKFVSEVPDRFFELDENSIPPELSVDVASQRIRISGTKQTDEAHTLQRNVHHYGKAVFSPAKEAAGSLEVDVPWSGDHAFYFVLLVANDGQVTAKEFQPRKGVTYTWRVSQSATDCVMSILDKDQILASVKVPSREAKSFGFAATVRFPGDKADLTIYLKK